MHSSAGSREPAPTSAISTGASCVTCRAPPTWRPIQPAGLVLYAELCGAGLARAHARSGDAAAITGYIGTGMTFPNAIAAFAEAYADQTDRDHAALVAAIDSGRLQAIERSLDDPRARPPSRAGRPAEARARLRAVSAPGRRNGVRRLRPGGRR